MHKLILGVFALVLPAGGACLWADPPPTGIKQPVVWNLDNLKSIGGHPVTVVGNPRVIETEQGKAIEFDGHGDALFVAANPLAEFKAFTAEVIFRPAAGGPKEQRFLHFQPNGSEDRLLFETRLTPDHRWFLDTYLHTPTESHSLAVKCFVSQ